MKEVKKENKPELVAFGQNIIGGVQSYYHNILSNDADDSFDKLWILKDAAASKDAKLIQPFNCCKEIVFSFAGNSNQDIAKELHELISNRKGIVMVNHGLELVTLDRYRKKKKTVVFVCHDEMYIQNALNFEYLIDIYIAHNPYFFDELRRKLPVTRSKDVYYMPYGIKPASHEREQNLNNELRVLFIARLTEKKGIFDLKKIDDELIRAGVSVKWTIVGDGPDKDRLLDDLKGREHFSFFTPPGNDEVLAIAQKNDVYVLPSYLDGLPVALLEAMSAGLVPIVSRFNPGIDSVINTGNGFVVDVGDVKGFANNLKYLNNNRSNLEQLSLNARKKILEEYEIKSRARNYYQLFKRFSELKRPLVWRRKKKNGGWDYPWWPQFVRNFFATNSFQVLRGYSRKIISKVA